MPFWKKSPGPFAKSVLSESALRGASHEQFAQEALAELTSGKSCDRAGVWLEIASHTDGELGETLQGAVWDRDNETVPREWYTLAPKRILPASRLVAGTVIEVDLEKEAGEPLVGATVGLSRVVWVPVEHAGKLRGMLMAGVVSPHSPLPNEQMTAVAAKLAMALAFESEHHKPFSPRYCRFRTRERPHPS